jgi:zinc transport system permease protein
MVMDTRMAKIMRTTTTPSMTMLDDFLVRAGLAAVGLSLATGPLGAFVVWRRMAYFGDATAHAAVLGVALALATDLPISLGTLTVALAMAHSALAFGLVAVSFFPSVRTDLSSYLFGDILAVSRAELGLVWLGSLAVLALLAWRWQALLTSTLSEDLAHAAGIRPDRERLVLVLALALVVAVALKIVGALLIAAMLIIPAATARSFSRTPEAMAAFAIAIGALSGIGGLGLSLWQDTPTGPSIIVVAAALFALASIRRPG